MKLMIVRHGEQDYANDTLTEKVSLRSEPYDLTTHPIYMCILKIRPFQHGSVSVMAMRANGRIN